MKKPLFLVILFALAFAKTVAIEEFELENKTEIYSFKGSIYLTCENKTVDVFLYDREPIKNAVVFLMYEYGVLSNAITDENGEASLLFTGNYQFMTKFFQIRIDKPTYKKMLINFDVDECKRGEKGFYIMHNVETFVPEANEENKSEGTPERNETNKTEERKEEQPVIKVEKHVEKQSVEKKEEEPPEKTCAPSLAFFMLTFVFLAGRRGWW